MDAVPDADSSQPTPLVSIVVVAFNMPRELPRTLASLSRRMQVGIEHVPYEIVVVDNGSDPPVTLPPDPVVRMLRVPDAPRSPARAINQGIAEARADLIGVFIDGARIASPGLVCHALLGSRLGTRAIIATLGFHLGPDVQSLAMTRRYDAAAEDGLLAASGWEQDGYRLFGIAAFAGSSNRGWFGPIAESNCLFMRRAMWRELDGYDERFQSPGGGLVNLDTYARACGLPGAEMVILLGEGTFHQFHGGVSTNAATSPWESFHAEYIKIRGKRFTMPEPDVIYLGRVHPNVMQSLHESTKRPNA